MAARALVTALLILTAMGPAQSETPPRVWWARNIGGTGLDTATGVAMDYMGNTYITGFAASGFTCNGLKFTKTGALENMFLIKLSATGMPIWIRQNVGTGDARGHSVAVDRGGAAYVTGYFTGTIKFGGATLTSQSDTRAAGFILKFDRNGNFKWAHAIQGGYDAEAHFVAAQASGCYVFGTYRNGVNLDGWVGAGKGCFLVRYDLNGYQQWYKVIMGNDPKLPAGLALDGQGGLYVLFENRGGDVTFQTYPPAKFDPMAHSAGLRYFLVHYRKVEMSPVIVVDWYKRVPGTLAISSFSGNCCAANSRGEVAVVTGINTPTPINFEGRTLQPVGGADICVMNFSNGSNLRWAKVLGGPSDDYGRGVVVDANGRIFLAGGFMGTAQFGDFSFQSADERDVFVAKLYPKNGQVLWAKQYGGPGVDFANGLSLVPKLTGDPVVCGLMDQETYLERQRLTSHGYADALVFRLTAAAP